MARKPKAYPMTDTTTFSADGISGEVRMKRGGDRFRTTALYINLPEALRETESNLILARFIDCIILTTRVDGLPFAWPKPNAHDDELAAAFEQWDSLPEDVLKTWLDTIDRTSYPVSDPATAPDAHNPN